MKTFVLTILLFTSFSSFGNYPYFHFESSNVKLSNDSFRRYIRPQIRNMIQEYYHLLKKDHSLHGDIILVRKKVDELVRSWQTLSADCKKQRDNCAADLKSFYGLARKLDLVLLGIQGKKLNFSNQENLKHTDSILNLSQKIDYISNLNYKILHKLEELLITVETSYFYHSNVINEFDPVFHEMLLNSEMILTSLLEKKYAQEFDFLWVNFMKKLESHVVQKRDSKYLIDNLGDLNMVWNSFHMRIAKSNLGYPSNRISVVSVMHNRWNSVLKLLMAAYKDGQKKGPH